MTTVYIDSSAAVKLVLDEAETDALADALDEMAAHDVPVVSSALLETELRRAAVREGIPQSTVTALLDAVTLVGPDRSLFHEAGILPAKGLRSLDALHLATAIRLGADQIVAYDRRMTEAARSLGLRVVAPA